jgi:hypothetical protein
MSARRRNTLICFSHLFGTKRRKLFCRSDSAVLLPSLAPKGITYLSQTVQTHHRRRYIQHLISNKEENVTRAYNGMDYENITRFIACNYDCKWRVCVCVCVYIKYRRRSSCISSGDITSMLMPDILDVCKRDILMKVDLLTAAGRTDNARTGKMTNSTRNKLSFRNGYSYFEKCLTTRIYEQHRVQNQILQHAH